MNSLGPDVHLSQFTKHQLCLDTILSPGALNSNRVAVQVAHEGTSNEHIRIFLASGRHVYVASIPSTTTDATNAVGQRGKGGVYLPHSAVDPVTCLQLPQLSLNTEIQSITLSAPDTTNVSTLALVDCYGRALTARLSPPEHPQEPPSMETNTEQSKEGSLICPPVTVASVQQLQPLEMETEAGWAGVSLASGQPNHTAVARHFAKDVTLFDGPMPVRTIHTLYHPYAVQLLTSTMAKGPSSSHEESSASCPVVAVAEGPAVSVWDVRASGRGARVARLMQRPHAGHLYCLAASAPSQENGAVGGSSLPVIGAAGQDRTVYIWDPRKWQKLTHWSNCIKYEATSLHFPACNSNYCLVGGLDYEVLLGRWGGSKRTRVGGGNRTGSTATAASSNANGVGAATTGGAPTAKSERLQGANGRGADACSNGPLERRNNAMTHDGERSPTSPLPCGDQQSVSFRGDSRWMGLAMAAGCDVVAGVSATKQLYLARLSASFDAS